MDRVNAFFGANARALDILKTNQNIMVGLAKLTESVLGGNTLIDGFTCSPTVPGSNSIVIGPGVIYQQAPIEATALSALAVDTHVISKPGLILDPTTLTLTPPNTIGQSVNILIQVQYQDYDDGQAVLNYYNAADPTTPLRGPSNNGQAQSTVRRGIAALSSKYGVPTTSGAQTTPSPDAGWSGIYVVTLGYGQTAISAGNIVQYNGSPVIAAKLGQIPQAVQSNTWNYTIDSGTSGLSIVANLFPTPLAIYDGFRASVKLARDLLPGAALSVNGTTGAIVRPGNINVGAADFRTGDILTVVRNGTSWIVDSAGNSLSVIDTAIVRTVGGSNPDFADLPTAFSWLSRRRILPVGSVTFQLPAGTGASKIVQTTPVVFSHENGDRVFIQGAPLSGPIPNPGVLTYSGNSPAARASDTAANLTALRAAYATEILLTNGSNFKVLGKLGNLQDILFTSDQTGTGVDLVQFINGVQTLTRVSCVNAQSNGLTASFSATTVVGTCHFLGSGIHGLSITNNGSILLTVGATIGAFSNAVDGIQVSGSAVYNSADVSGSGPVTYARGNGVNGVEANGAIVVLSAASQSNNNGQAAFFASNPSVIRASGCVMNGNPYGCWANFFSFIDGSSTSGASSSFSFRADNASQIYRIGTTATGTVSPTVGTAGNNLSNII